MPKNHKTYFVTYKSPVEKRFRTIYYAFWNKFYKMYEVHNVSSLKLNKTRTSIVDCIILPTVLCFIDKKYLLYFFDEFIGEEDIKNRTVVFYNNEYFIRN